MSVVWPCMLTLELLGREVAMDSLVMYVRIGMW